MILVNLGFVVLAVIIPVAVLHVVFAARSRKRFHAQAGQLDRILAYGWGLKGFDLGVAGFWLFALLLGTRGLQNPPPWDPPDIAVVIVPVAIVFPLWAFGVEVFGAEYHLTPAGIGKHSPWTKNFIAPWEDIESLSYNSTFQWVVLRTKEGKIRIHDYIGGRRSLLNAMEAAQATGRLRLPIPEQRMGKR